MRIFLMTLKVIIAPSRITVYRCQNGKYVDIANFKTPYSLEEFKLWYDITNQTPQKISFEHVYVHRKLCLISKNKFESLNFPELPLVKLAMEGKLKRANYVKIFAKITSDKVKKRFKKENKMSYYIKLVDRENREPATIKISPEEQISANICLSNDPIEASFNVTYNYSDFFGECFGENGIRDLYEKPINKVLKEIDSAISYLKSMYYDNKKFWVKKTDEYINESEADYWKSCPYNVVSQLEYIKKVINQVLEQNPNTDYILIGD